MSRIIWRKDGRDFRQRAQCGYVMYTHAFRHGKVSRRSDVWIDGGKMSDISVSKHNAVNVVFPQAFSLGKIYRRSAVRERCVKLKMSDVCWMENRGLPYKNKIFEKNKHTRRWWTVGGGLRASSSVLIFCCPEFCSPVVSKPNCKDELINAERRAPSIAAAVR